MQKTVSQKTFIASVIGAFILALFISAAAMPNIKENEQRIVDLEEVKAIDDEIITQCGDGILAVSEGMTYAFARDVEGMDKTTTKIQAVTRDIQTLIVTRKNALEDLGY
jgi:hypothetical protein